jgi:arylformamidase
MATNYDALYNPRLSVPNFAEIFKGWTERSAEARSRAPAYLDVPYGTHDTEKLDLFMSDGPSRGLLMFIHGGYWRALDKKDHSFIAPGFTQAGVTVAIVNYALCPAVTVEDIVRQMLQATAWLYRNGGNFGAPFGKVHVAGHSAGGHLTAMMLAALWPKFAADLPKKVVQGGFSISGVYDVAPLMHVPIVNDDVRFTPESAKRVSPAFMPPATDAPLYTAVGGEEQRGFHDQNALIAKNWKKVHAADVACPGENHFSILDRLAAPGSTLNTAVLRMMGLR